MEIERRQGNREAVVAYLAQVCEGLYSGSPTPAPFVGGRKEGMRRLRVFNVADYAEKRNDVGTDSGASQLSPYIRHGCLSLTEAKAHGVSHIGVAHAVRWIQELAWRQFWRLYYAKWGNTIFEDQEPAKVSLGKRSETLPDDIATASTGLHCMDTTLQTLFTTGYIPNHARMWFAAYLIHHRKVDWRVGARLFYQYLLDGDHASNTLSWQWVASTFAHKPYFFNRQNVEKYSRDRATGETWCTHCPAARQHTCPFDASYEVLGKRLFGPDYSTEPARSFHRRPGKR